MKKIFFTIFSLMILAIFITGCEEKVNSAPNLTLQNAVISTGNSSITIDPVEIKNETIQNEEKFQNVSFTVTGIEGDLITLNLKAVDPDGDKLKYTYSEPFNDKGLWQTKDGDAGKYLVRVTANDGKLEASTDLLVLINPSNKAPQVNCPETINVKEGDEVKIKCTFFDKENDTITVEYSGWMTSETYTTNFDSEGKHEVYVKVSDGNSKVTKTIEVYVENVDRPPIFDKHLKDIVAIETDIITLKPEISDPDGDKVTLKYSEPFDSKGVWKTKIGDAGTYPISVVASDGTLTTKETFTLTLKMLNTAPVMNTINNITVDEGEQVIIKPDVADREDDPITITYSGWMKSSKYTTTYEDAYPKGCNKNGCSAEYKVTVTATDGSFEISQDVYITVKDKNRPPEFVWP